MITKAEMKDIPGRVCPRNNEVTRDVLEFHKSDWDACEVNIEKYKSVQSACGAYRDAIKKAKVGVVAIQRKGRLFLIRSEGK